MSPIVHALFGQSGFPITEVGAPVREGKVEAVADEGSRLVRVFYSCQPRIPRIVVLELPRKLLEERIISVVWDWTEFRRAVTARTPRVHIPRGTGT